MIGKAIETHHAGDGLFGDGKCPPETTTLIRSGKRNEIDPREMFEELTRLTEGITDPLRAASESKFAQAMATVVESDGVRVAPLQGSHLQDIDEILAKFVGATPNPFIVGFEGRVVEVFVVVLPHHGGTTSGGGDDMVVITKDPDESFGQGLGGIRTAGVSHRLAATGLGFGVFDLNAEAFQKFHRGKPDVRIKLIDEAGDKQPDARHVHGLSAVSFKREIAKKNFRGS